jgi:methionyl-tRNA formyltransferase
MGTAELACASLAALAMFPHTRILGVVTQPDRPQGRNLKLQAPPVKRAARERGLTVLQPDRARDPGFVAQLAALAPDLIVVAAYGQILPASILELPPHGCLNVHTSLLPRYRGAAPIQWAILNGDTTTGVTLMRINEQLDAGDIVAQCTLPIGPDETAESLHQRLALAGAQLLVASLPDYLEGRTTPRPQPDTGISYAPKIRKDDGRIDWTLTGWQLYNRFRAFTPWPGSFTFLPATPQPLRVRICQAQVADASGPPGTVLQAGPNLLRVACGASALDLLSLQREGGRPLATREFLAGHPIPLGASLLNCSR